MHIKNALFFNFTVPAIHLQQRNGLVRGFLLRSVFLLFAYCDPIICLLWFDFLGCSTIIE
jgi:hypothetical protein